MFVVQHTEHRDHTHRRTSHHILTSRFALFSGFILCPPTLDFYSYDMYVRKYKCNKKLFRDYADFQIAETSSHNNKEIGDKKNLLTYSFYTFQKSLSCYNPNLIPIILETIHKTFSTIFKRILDPRNIIILKQFQSCFWCMP